MKYARSLALAGLVLSSGLALAQAPAAGARQQTDIKTPLGRYKLEVAPEYLGMAGKKTVVRLRLSSPELSKAASSKGARSVSGEVRGTFAAGGQTVDAFRYPVTGDINGGKVFSFSFLRAVPPGTYHVAFVFNDPDGRQVGEGAIDLFVPEIGTVFRPEMAPADASTLPDAEAIVLADAAGAPRTPAAEPRVKIIPPDREAPLGLLRLTAEVEPPVTKVEFFLDDRLLVSRNRPPFSVEIDLGNIPRRQTVRAVGYDDGGSVVDEDAYAINEGTSRVAVRVLPQPDAQAGTVRIKVAVQSIAGGVAKKVDLFLDDKKIGSWTDSGPYEATIPYAEYARGTYVRATAIAEDGRESNDIRMLRGPQTTVESVRVDVVQLHVSAVDKEGRFVKGLTKDSFSVAEDGRPQTLSGFEVAENLPLNIGLVIDSSGSMEKGMPFVREACAELFRGLMRPKDRGFVVEFRDQPKFLQELTSDGNALQRASRDLKAGGATALYDAVILGLYQFRTLTGRKALVVVTDGDDNRSHVEFDTLLRYARSAGAPIYFIAVNIPLTDFKSRRIVNEIARESGGEVFAIGNASKIGEVTKRIEEELRSQYVLAYKSDSAKPAGEYRGVTVAIAAPGVTARTVRGYIP